MKKYFGNKSKQDFIDDIKESEVTLYYRKASYEIWLDGRGWCIAMISFNGGNITSQEQDATLKAYETIEELIDNYVFYDGTKLSAAVEMDSDSFQE